MSVSRRKFIKQVGLAVIASTLPFANKCGHESRKPNIIFILADDLGWTDLGCYGSDFYETPNIDALATEGMRFTQAYAACPVCSPTRASILTGKYPARLHLTDYIPGRRNLSCQPLKNAVNRQELPAKEITIAETLKSADYNTVSIGKWHLGGKGSLPEDHGFDINIGGYKRGAPASYFYPYESGQDWNPKIENLPGGEPGEYLTDRLTNEAVNYIKENQNNPFFMYLSHYAVHDPLQAKQEKIKKYEQKITKMQPQSGPDYVLEGNPAAPDEKYFNRDSLDQLIHEPEYAGHGYLPNRTTKIKQKQDNAVFAAMLESLDESVGKVVATLKELNLYDNTLIFFFGDNGGMASPDTISTGNLPLRGGKGWLYEGGIREPLIIRYPEWTKAGTISDEPVTSTDFYPTMLSAAGLQPLPEQHPDGKSLVPVIKGKSLDRDAIFWHWPHYSNHGQQSPGGAIRMGDYKLIEYFENSTVELFDLKNDIGEQVNLAEEKPAITTELKTRLAQWRRSVDAAMPTPNEDYKMNPNNIFDRW